MKEVVYRNLSKSKYLLGLQCLKYLWISVNTPELIPEVDDATQLRFDQGHLAGELAKKLFGGGVDIPVDDFEENKKQTKILLKKRIPLFEAGIAAKGVYCRPDILNPVDSDYWDIIEVKSSTSVKDVNIQDVSFQKLCCERAGLKIRDCFLMYINSDYIRDGELEPDKLFIVENITPQVFEVSAGIEERVQGMQAILLQGNCPEVNIGSHCSSPYDCPLTGCWDFLPEDSVFTLYRGGKKSFDLFSNGLLAIQDIPADYPLNA